MGTILRMRSAAGETRDVDVEAFARSAYPALIKRAGAEEFAERAWTRIQQSDSLYGDAMPWAKTHQKIRFRPGEVTAWIGPNRDGKSLLLGYLAAHWALQETPITIASLEMDVGTQIKRLSRQLLCTETPTRSNLDMLLQRLTYLNFFDFTGHLPSKDVLSLVKFAAGNDRARHVIVDNMTLIIPPGRNTDEQSATFVRGLVEVARDTGCHVHLVGHVRKPDEDRYVTRYDWRGTGACPDMVHNVIIIQANEKKRRAADKEDFSRSSEPDVFITVDKQRNGEYHGRLGFWWRAAALRLVEYGTDEPVPIDPYDFSMWDR